MQSLNLKTISLISLFMLVFTAQALAESWIFRTERRKNLMSDMARIEQEIHENVLKKRSERNPEKLKFILRDISRSYDELRDVHDDYLENERIIRFRYPEKEDANKRQYTLYKLKTLDEIENDVGIDGHLDRVKRRMMKVYRPKLKSDEEENVDEQIAKKPKHDPDRIRITK